MHAPISAVFSLFVLPLSFFLSVLSLLLVSYYSPAVGCSPLFGLSFSWVPLSGCLLLSYHGFSPLSASLHWVSLFQCFSLFPCFFLLLFVPFFCHGYLPFIANLFNGISPFYPQGFTNFFWFVVGIISRLPTHPLVTSAIAQYMFTTTLLISRQNYLLFVPAVYLYLQVTK